MDVLRNRRTPLLICAVVAACCLGNGRRADPRYVSPPLVNPTRFLAIQGAIAPAMGLELWVAYETTAESCRVVLNRFEGVVSDQMYRHAVAVERSSGGFQATAPLDVVEAGACGWRAWGIEYIASLDGRRHSIPVPPSPVLWFRDGAAQALPPIRIECGPQTIPRIPLSTAGDGPECDETGGGDRFLAPEATALELDVQIRSVPDR
jgi:hypothetical protein